MLSEKEIEQLAVLSRLNLTQDEQVQFVKQLSNVLAFAQQISNVADIPIEDGVSYATHDTVWREDVVVPSEAVDELRQAAHEQEDGYIKTKAIF